MGGPPSRIRASDPSSEIESLPRSNRAYSPRWARGLAAPALQSRRDMPTHKPDIDQPKQPKNHPMNRDQEEKDPQTVRDPSPNGDEGIEDDEDDEDLDDEDQDEGDEIKNATD